jgi:hypothetical protein
MTDRFILILTALWKWVGEKAGPEMTGAMCWAIRAKLSRVQARFAVLAKRFHDGTLCPPKPRARSPKPPPGGSPPKPRPPSVFPRHFGWLCGLVPTWAAGCGSQMQYLLGHPDLEAMAAASPEVGRLIRPLMWATGRVPPAYLAWKPRSKRELAGLPPRARPRRPAPVAPPQPVAARPPDPWAVPPCMPRNPNRPPPPPPPPEPEPERWNNYRFHPGSPLKGM